MVVRLELCSYFLLPCLVSFTFFLGCGYDTMMWTCDWSILAASSDSSSFFLFGQKFQLNRCFTISLKKLIIQFLTQKS